ncbi:MAG: hypothetical protein GC159_03980 [Phycisphaera sp.]|nr:hypothetical protein [Phycisphaera sp.]
MGIMPFHRRGFTMMDLAVVVAIVTLLVALAFGPGVAGLSRARKPANRTICMSNLSSLYKAMYAYSTTHRDAFPIAGNTDLDTPAIGFREGDRATGEGAVLTNNATASLWLLARGEYAGSIDFVCPSTMDENDPAVVGRHGERPPYPIEHTHDFARRGNLSYSMMNMYHGHYGRQWNADVHPDQVLLGDHNPNVFASPDDAELPAFSNSPNHGFDGQNVLFGDGHVEFLDRPFDPYAHNDNLYAGTVDGQQAPPTLDNRIGDAGDQMLLPLTGDGFASLSGKANDVEWVFRPLFPWWLGAMAIGVLATVGLAWTVRRKTEAEHKPVTREARWVGTFTVFLPLVVVIVALGSSDVGPTPYDNVALALLMAVGSAIAYLFLLRRTPLPGIYVAAGIYSLYWLGVAIALYRFVSYEALMR